MNTVAARYARENRCDDFLEKEGDGMLLYLEIFQINSVLTSTIASSSCVPYFCSVVSAYGMRTASPMRR